MTVNAKKPAKVLAGFSNNNGLKDVPAAEPKHGLIITRSQQEIGKSDAPFSWTWRGDNFVKVEPGTYRAICPRWKGPEWIPAYRRYGFRLFFHLLAEDVEVTMFLNFGAKPQPPKSIASNYFKAWTIANGEAPLRGQAMPPTVFTDDGLLYTVEIADAKIDPTTKKDKPPCLVYSRVKEILDVTRP